MNINKNVVVTFNAFLLSPFLSIPFLLIQLKKGIDTGICLIISLLAGIFSMLYIPNFTNDKVRYIERFEVFSKFTFSDFVSYFSDNSIPDYIFNSLIYSFSKLHLDIKYLFFLLTFLSVYLTLSAIKRIINRLSDESFIYSISVLLLVIFSFSLVNMLSGLRFFLGGSFFIWFIYFLYFDRKYAKAILVLLLSVLTHFSYAFMALAAIFALMNPPLRILRISLILSSFFLIAPSSLFESIFSVIDLPVGYSNKVEVYTSIEIEYSGNFLVLSYIKNIWYYLAFLYLILSKETENNRFYILLVCFLILINITYPIPVIFNRYIGYFKIVFVTYLIYMIKTYNIRKPAFYLLYFLCLISFLVEIFVLRNNILESYQISEMWNIFHILLKEQESLRFIY